MIGRAVQALAVVALLTACQSSPAPPQTPQALPRVVEIWLGADNTIALNGRTVTLKELRVAFREMAALDPQPHINLGIDPRATFEGIMGVMVAAKMAGLEDDPSLIGKY